MKGDRVPNIEQLRQILVNNIEPNEVETDPQFLRRGDNMIQRMISNKKRRQNMEPIAFPKLVHNEDTINEQLDAEHQSESSDAEDQSESGDEESMSKSPAFNPTSPATMSTVNSYATSQPSTVKSIESSSARTQGPRTILEFTPVREPEPAVEQEHTEKSDMSMFTVPITMNSAQVQSSNWMIDSGAGMSGTSSTNNLKNTMRCKIPITPAFGSVMDATSEGTINDQTLGPLGIRAIHIEGMHHNLLSVYQVCAGGESGEEQVGIFTSEGCQFFPLSKCKDALKIMSKCSNTFYGLVNGGVYVYAPAGTKK